MKPKAYSYIRFSTPEQEKGDSLRRQMEGAENMQVKIS
jgi:DNA invertase Pin-like site-specific DNA recombinase